MAPTTIGSTRSRHLQKNDDLPQFAYDVVSRVDRKHFWYIIRNERILSLIRQRHSNLAEVSFLEIGCGTGNVIGYLHEHGLSDVVGYDLNPKALEVCKNRYPNLNFKKTNFLDVDSCNKRFDVVGMFDVLEHLPSEQDALVQVRKHVQPGGTFVMTVPAHSFLWSKMDEIYGHHRRYTKKRLNLALEKAGFTDIHIAYFMAPLVPLLLLRRKFMRLPSQLSLEETVAILRDDAKYPGDFINATLQFVMRSEHKLLGMKDFNFGGSLIAIAKAPK